MTGNENAFGPIEVYVAGEQVVAARQFLDLGYVEDEAPAPRCTIGLGVVAGVVVASIAVAIAIGVLTDVLR